MEAGPRVHSFWAALHLIFHLCQKLHEHILWASHTHVKRTTTGRTGDIFLKVQINFSGAGSSAQTQMKEQQVWS